MDKEFELKEKFNQHRHNGADSPKVQLKSLEYVKQTALTAKDGGVVNTGDATSDGVIDNNRTRIEEIEVALQNLGLLN